MAIPRTIIGILIAISLGFCTSGCSRFHLASHETTIDRVAVGVGLGSTVAQVQQLLPVTEDDDPVASLLLKYASPEKAEYQRKITKIAHLRFSSSLLPT
jgi:hypothetical protein